MSVWETREAGFEKVLEVEAELRFKSLARRNKLIGLWAAEKLGMTEAAAQDYARRIVEAQVGSDDDEALARRLEARFAELDPPDFGASHSPQDRRDHGRRGATDFRGALKLSLERLRSDGTCPCHSRESGNPGIATCGSPWIPAFAGMTTETSKEIIYDQHRFRSIENRSSCGGP